MTIAVPARVRAHETHGWGRPAVSVLFQSTAVAGQPVMWGGFCWALPCLGGWRGERHSSHRQMGLAGHGESCRTSRVHEEERGWRASVVAALVNCSGAGDVPEGTGEPASPVFLLTDGLHSTFQQKVYFPNIKVDCLKLAGLGPCAL